MRVPASTVRTQYFLSTFRTKHGDLGSNKVLLLGAVRNGPLQSTRTATTGVGTPGRGHRQPGTLAGKGWTARAPTQSAGGTPQDPCRAKARGATSGTPRSPNQVGGRLTLGRSTALALEGAPFANARLQVLRPRPDRAVPEQ